MAQTAINNTLSKIYNNEFNEAEHSIKPIRIKYHDHPVLYILDGLMLYWKSFPISFNTKEANKYKSMLLLGIEKSKKLPESEQDKPENKFTRMLLEIMLTQEYFDEGHTWKAVGSMKAAFPYIKHGFILQKNFSEFYFTTGMYKYYRELFAENHSFYSAIASVFFPSGNKKYGLACIDTASSRGVWVKANAMLWASIIYLRYEHDLGKATAYAKSLADSYPQNTYFQTIYIENLLMAGNYETARKALELLPENNNNYYRMSAALFNGMLAEHKTNLSAAERYYRQALEAAHVISEVNQNYVGLADYRLGKICLSRGQPGPARLYFKAAHQYCNDESVRKATEKY